MPSPGIEPTTLAYQDDALTNWTTGLYSLSFNMSIAHLAEEVECWDFSLGNWCRSGKWHLSVTLKAVGPGLPLGLREDSCQTPNKIHPGGALSDVNNSDTPLHWFHLESMGCPRSSTWGRLIAVVSWKLTLFQFFWGGVPRRTREGPRKVNCPTLTLPNSLLPHPPCSVSLGHGKSLAWKITQLERQAELSAFYQDT